MRLLAPSAPCLFSIFSRLTRQHLLTADGTVIQIFEPKLTKLQQLVLHLLGVPVSAHRCCATGQPFRTYGISDRE